MIDRLELGIIVLGALIVVNAWLTENALKRIKKLEMSKCECHCPRCGDLMEMRDFMDGGDINRDYWCPVCRLRWVTMDIEPMKAKEK